MSDERKEHEQSGDHELSGTLDPNKLAGRGGIVRSRLRAYGIAMNTIESDLADKEEPHNDDPEFPSDPNLAPKTL